VPSHGDTHEIVHNCDVFPTVLAAAGVKVDPQLKIDGMNLLDVWLGNGKSPERTLFWEWREDGDVQFAAMHGDMKMVATGGNKPELFNIELDPAERKNIGGDHADELKAMSDGLHAWLKTETDAAKQKAKPTTTNSTTGATSASD